LNGKEVYALRGACRALNTPEDIEIQVAALYDGILAANSLDEEGIISLIFSVTADLDALNPAAALRRSGICDGVFGPRAGNSEEGCG
jgi:chorismate mutase